MEEEWSSIDTAEKRFWTEEQDYGVCKILSKNDKRGEEILKSTIQCGNNRYTKAIMRKKTKMTYPESKNMAWKILFANERIFARKQEYAKKYDDVIQDYANSYCRAAETELKNEFVILRAQESKLKTFLNCKKN